MEGIEFGFDFRAEDVSGDAGGVNADGTVVDSSDVALDVDPLLVRGGLVTANSDGRRDEVTLVGIGLEADEVGAEHPFENLPAACVLHKRSVGFVPSGTSDTGGD